MSTTENKELNFSNFIGNATFTTGKGKLTKQLQKLNWYDPRLQFVINETMNCQQFEVKVPSYLPNISYKFYQTTSLWWLLGRFNHLIFPLEEIQPGVILLIPSISDISKAINKVQGMSTGASNKTVTI